MTTVEGAQRRQARAPGPVAPLPLRRLVGGDVRQLLDTVTEALPDFALALVDLDGSVVVASGRWPDGAVESAGTGEAQTFELAPHGLRVGSLVSRGEAPQPVLAAMQQSVALLVRESVEKHDLARETLERYRELSLLYRSSETIGALLIAGEVPGHLLAEAQRVIPFDAGVVFLGASRQAAEWHRAGEAGTDETIETLLAASAQLIDETKASGRPDIADWPEALPGRPATALVVPVRAGEELLGMVVLGRLAEASVFTAGDERLVLGLAGQAGVALERAWAHEREGRRLQLEEELAVARRIQLTLLPAAPPQAPGWRFAASYRPAREVGGDFYDFLDHALAAGRLGLVIGDVVGKGMPAALLMAYARAVLRAESSGGGRPHEVLARANGVLIRERQSRPFLTVFHAELELDSGRLSYASAGHDPPLWIGSDGQARLLEASGVILGAFSEPRLESQSVVLGAGDTVVLSTAGITEARSPRRELFGEDRLRAVAAGAAAGGPESVLEAVTSAVADFAADAEQADDITIVVVQREGSQPWSA